jgi:hypothetical protein
MEVLGCMQQTLTLKHTYTHTQTQGDYGSDDGNTSDAIQYLEMNIADWTLSLIGWSKRK